MATPADRIYLDHAATTPMDPQVFDAMRPFLESTFGNPSSLHYWGREAKKALEASRARIAQCLDAQASEIVFTSGATEADNLVLFGVCDTLKAKGRHIITTQIEHAAVDKACEHLEQQGWDVTRLPVDSEGFVDPNILKAAIRPDTVLASIIHGHNEIGTIQDVVQLGQMLHDHGVLFHLDAVQTVGKIPIPLSQWPVDYLSLSAHKLYGPKGVGALYIRHGAPLPSPMILGGGQEHALRSGTENLAGIVGLAEALDRSTQLIPTEGPRLRGLQERFIQEVQAAIPEAMLNGPQDVQQRVPGNVNFSFPPAEGEALVLHLDLKGIAVSTGSACHSAVIEPSRIIKALGKSDAIARATVRFSMGRSTNSEALERVIAILPNILKRFQPKQSVSH